MKLTVREYEGSQYGEAQAMGEVERNSLPQVREAARAFFAPTRVRVTRQGTRYTVREGPREWGIFVEPATHPDN